jgi:hypothetical protein
VPYKKRVNDNNEGWSLLLAFEELEAVSNDYVLLEMCLVWCPGLNKRMNK